MNIIYNVQYIVFLFALSSEACPTTEGWIYSSERCFYLIEYAQTWIDAVHHCTNINKDAVVMMPKTKLDMEAVRQIMQR